MIEKKQLIEDLPLFHQGKVRDVYAVGEKHLLMVASDRLSAFDVVLPDAIPGKGRILTSISNFWFDRFSGLVNNHLTNIALDRVVSDSRQLEYLSGRSVIVQRLKPLSVEAIVRGYIIGSGWKDYCRHQSICGIALPLGLLQAAKLDEPIFTPSTKAAVGSHDENIRYEQSEQIIGKELAHKIREVSLSLYQHAAEYALKRGIIIADTKFEFGLDENDALVLMDEVLTPDSSRFWPQSSYRVGISPPSFDKQFVRDYLETLDWNKSSPGPNLPQSIVKRTTDIYREAEKLLTGDASVSC